MASEERLGAREVVLTDEPGAAAANPRKNASSNMACVLIDSQRICNKARPYSGIYTQSPVKSHTL